MVVIATSATNNANPAMRSGRRSLNYMVPEQMKKTM